MFEIIDQSLYDNKDKVERPEGPDKNHHIVLLICITAGEYHIKFMYYGIGTHKHKPNSKVN